MAIEDLRINQYGSNIPPDVWDPLKYKENEDFWDVLQAKSRRHEKKKEEERAHRTSIAFAPGGTINSSGGLGAVGIGTSGGPAFPSAAHATVAGQPPAKRARVSKWDQDEKNATIPPQPSHHNNAVSVGAILSGEGGLLAGGGGALKAAKMEEDETNRKVALDSRGLSAT